MPVTTVFEIGPGKFTIVLYPSPSLSSGSSSTATPKPSLTTTTYGTTRTATRSIDKNVHQVSTSIPESDYYGYNYTSTVDYLTTDSNGATITATSTTTGYSPYPTSTGGNGTGYNSSGLVGATTILSGVTYTLGMEPYTWTSNGGVYTSERVMRVPVQTGSEREITEKNKSILTPIITAVVLTIVLGFLASLGGCWFYRRRRRRLRASADGNVPGTPTREKGLQGRDGGGNRNRSRSNAERERGRLSRLNVDMAQVGLGSGTLGSGRGLLSASTAPGAGISAGTTSTTALNSTTSPSLGNGSGSATNFTRRLSVDEEDEPRIETMSIEEGTVTPFTLPAMMANAALATGTHPETTRNRTHSFSTLSTDDDAFAVDGDSIARTLTGSSLGSSNGPPAYEEIEGGTYERAMLSGMDSNFRSTLSPSLSRGSGSALAYLEPAFGTGSNSNSSGGHSTLMPRDPFADPQLLRRPTLHHQPSQSSLAESTLSSTPSSLLHPPVSEGGRSERSNPQTEASFQRGDDRTLHIGDEWARIAARANNQGLPGLTVRNGTGSFQGWSDSEVEDSDDEGTIMAGSDRVLGDDESWVNGSEFGRRTRQRERDGLGDRGSNREEDDDDDVFGDAHRAQ